jgi:Na+/proline symporter
LLRISRISMIGVSIVIFLIGLWQPPSVMWIGYFAATLFAASWGPVAFASVYSKKVTKVGAFWSIIVGFLGVILGESLKKLGIVLPVYLNPVIIGVVLSLVVLLIGSRFGVITDAERAFQEKILRRPVDLNEAEEIAITRRYPGILMVSGIIIIAITFAFYFYPTSLIMPK